MQAFKRNFLEINRLTSFIIFLVGISCILSGEVLLGTVILIYSKLCEIDTYFRSLLGSEIAMTHAKRKDSDFSELLIK